MKRQRWQSPAAVMLMIQTGQADAAAAITTLAQDLLDEAGHEPPFDCEILASLRGVVAVRYRPMAGAARLVPESGALVIEVNDRHSRGKQRFSINHEITHTLLPTYSHSAIDDFWTGRFPDDWEEERLCDLGAATLLLDPRWLRPRALALGPSLGTLFTLAAHFDASLEATARMISRLDLWPCAFVVWEEGFRKAERIGAGQVMFPELEHLGRPQPKFRVSRVYCSPSLPWFIAPNKSVVTESVIHQCSAVDGIMSAVESIDLGPETVEAYVEARYTPYVSDSVLKTRVVSLLVPRAVPHPSSDGAVVYRMEIE